MATVDSKVKELIINQLTKSEYDSATKSKNEIYTITDDGFSVAASKISNLLDVNLDTAANKQLLVYNSTNNKWENSNKKLIFDESLIDLGTVTSNITINTTTANRFILAVNANITIDLSTDIVDGASKTVSLLVNPKGTYTITWADKIRWPNNTPPTLVSGKVCLITFTTFDGYNWFSTSINNFTALPKPWVWVEGEYTEHNGRKFQRHPSNMGTVMSFVDRTGTSGPEVERNVLVLDAKYRAQNTSTKFYRYYTSNNVNLNSSGKLQDCIYAGRIGASLVVTTWDGEPDSTLNSDSSFTLITNQDTHDSKYNTQYLVDYHATNTEAAHYCRTITVPDVGKCDMPNINTLSRIMCEMKKLDSMDPTVSSYPALKLTSLGYYISSSYAGYQGPTPKDYNCYFSVTSVASLTTQIYFMCGADYVNRTSDPNTGMYYYRVCPTLEV